MFPSRVARRKISILWRGHVLPGLKNCVEKVLIPPLVVAIWARGLFVVVVTTKNVGLLTMAGVCNFAFQDSLDCKERLKVAEVPPLERGFVANNGRLERVAPESGQRGFGFDTLGLSGTVVKTKKEMEGKMSEMERTVSSEGASAMAKRAAGIAEGEILVDKDLVRRAEQVRKALSNARDIVVTPYDSMAASYPLAWFSGKDGVMLHDEVAGAFDPLSYLFGLLAFFAAGALCSIWLRILKIWRDAGRDDPSMESLSEADAIDSSTTNVSTEDCKHGVSKSL